MPFTNQGIPSYVKKPKWIIIYLTDKEKHF